MTTLASHFASLTPFSSNREATKFKNIIAKIGNPYASLHQQPSSTVTKDNRIVASARFAVVRSNDKSLDIIDIQQDDNSDATSTRVELTQPITAVAFSPFDDGLLASGNTKRLDLYRIPFNGDECGSKSVKKIDCVSSFDGSRCQLLGFNPIVDTCLLSVTDNSELLVHDLNKIELPILRYNKFKEVHSFDWCLDASSISVAAEDTLSIFDIRSNDQLEFKSNSTFNPAKTFYTKWLGNTPYIISSILSQKRTKSVQLWDVRNTTEPLSTIIDTQVSGGPWLPIVDISTYILYMVTINDTVNPLVSHVNLRTMFDFQSKFIPNSLERSVTTNQISLPSKIIDATLVPTRSLCVKENEVSRLLLLTGNSNNNEGKIVPLGYFVPSKLDMSYKDDLYLNVMKPDSLINFEDWLNGSYSTKQLMTTMSLDPVIGNQIERHNVDLGSFSQQHNELENELKKAPHIPLQSPESDDACRDLCHDLEQNAKIQEFEEYTALGAGDNNYMPGYMNGFAGARRVEHERMFISAVSKIVDFNDKPPIGNVAKKDDFEENEWSD